MLNALSAEIAKARLGRAWWMLLASGIGLCLLTSYGFAADAKTKSATAPLDLESLTGVVARSWMMVFLFAALLGANLVTREYSAATIGRTTLAVGRRGRVFVTKVCTGAIVGVVYGAVAVVCALAVTPLVFAQFGWAMQWSSDTTWTVVGIFGCNVLGAVWGVLVGWVLRHGMAAAMVVAVVTLLIDPGMQRLVPDAARYLFTIALSSLYRDGKPELLAIPLALAVAAAWLIAWGALGRRVYLRQDVG